MFLWDSKNNIFRTTNDGKVNLFDKNFYEISEFHYYDFVTFDSKEENIIYKDGSNIYIWDITQNTIVPLIKEITSFGGYTISKNKKYILAWDDFGNLKLWNKTFNKIEKILKHDSKIEGAIFNSDYNKVISWDENGNIKLLIRQDINKNSKLFDYFEKYARKTSEVGVKFTKDAKELLIWSKYKGVELLNVKDNTLKLIIPYKTFIIDSEVGKASVSYALFNKSENEVVSGGLDGKIKLWDRKIDKVKTIIEFDSKLFKNQKKKNYHYIKKIIYSNNEKLIVTWLNQDNGEVKLWNRDTNEVITPMNCNKDGIYDVKFNHKGDQLLTLCRDGKLKLWDKNSNKVTLVMDNKDFFNSAEFTKDDKNILIWGFRNKSKYNVIKIWNQKNNRIKTILKYKNIAILLDRCFLSNKNNNEILLYGIDQKVKLWNIKSDNIHTIIKFNTNYSSNSKALYGKDENRVFALDDNVIKIWDRKNNKIIDSIHSDNIESFILNKESNKILYWNSSEIKIYDINIQKNIFILKNKWTKKVEFSEDEKQLLITSLTGFIKTYNLYEDNKFIKKDYILDAEIKTGTYLTPLGEVKALTNEEWLEKKKEYEEALNESNISKKYP